MRLSDIKGERTIDVIADIIGPVATIAEDEEAAKLFRKQKLPEGTTPKEFALKRIKEMVPVLLKTHKRDIIAILAAIEGVTQDEYAKSMNLVKLTKDCVDLVTDEEFLSLFTSAQSERSSGSVRGNIKGKKA